MERTIAVAVLAMALAACQQNDPNNIAIDEGNSFNGEVETLPPDEGNDETAAANSQGALNEADDAGSENPNQAFIPAQYRGRWGMVPNDCQPGRADAKGLIAIGDTTIKFYEAVATLKEQRPAIATSFAGQFDFTGEGQNWQKVMTFTRTGDKLKRAEEEGTFTYTRCA
jgi:hypothetical protein